jgi:hypothetical protein
MKINKHILKVIFPSSGGSLLTDHCSGDFLNCIGRATLLVQRIICFQSTTTPRKCFLDAPIALNPLWNQVIQRTSIVFV